MITGANRKEKGRMVQFRAPIEYDGALELVMELINEKIGEVGSTERITISDVMKLSIECLVKGKKSIDILGKEIVISELIQHELQDYQDISLEDVEKEVKFYLIERLKEIIEIYEDRMINNLLNEQEIEMLKILETQDCTREEIEYSMEASEEEQEAFGLKKMDTIENYLELLCEAYSLIELEFKMETVDYDSIREYVEVAVFEGEHATRLQALKMFDQYRYCYILNSLRRYTDQSIKLIKDYFSSKSNGTKEKGAVYKYLNSAEYRQQLEDQVSKQFKEHVKKLSKEELIDIMEQDMPEGIKQRYRDELMRRR